MIILACGHTWDCLDSWLMWGGPAWVSSTNPGGGGGGAGFGWALCKKHHWVQARKQPSFRLQFLPSVTTAICKLSKPLSPWVAFDQSFITAAESRLERTLTSPWGHSSNYRGPRLTLQKPGWWEKNKNAEEIFLVRDSWKGLEGNDLGLEVLWPRGSWPALRAS